MGRKKKLKKPPLEEDTSNLPCDIIQNILSRLPVKSLLRFKSVSKPWYSIISDPQFAKVHLSQSKSYLATSRTRVFHRARDPLVEKFPETKYQDARVVGSNDGLVLLKKEYGDEMYVIWNPSTRTCSKFKCPYRMFTRFVTAAICYEQCDEDYKVLIMDESHHATFSFKTNSWTERKLLTSIRHVGDDNELVVAQGVPHYFVRTSCEGFKEAELEEQRSELATKRCKKCDKWSSYHYDNHPVYECQYYNAIQEICYFDFTNDQPKKLAKPVCLDDTCAFHLASLRNQLCLYRNTYDFSMMEIWMMKEYGNPNSWMRLLTIENMPVAMHGCKNARPFCYTVEGDIVIHYSCDTSFEHGHGQGVIYSTSKKNFRQARCHCGHLCFDSLVLPKRKYPRKPTEQRQALDTLKSRT